MTMENKKNKLFSQKLKELIRKQLLVIIVLIISQILTAFSGWTIVDPILQKTMPSEIKIDTERAQYWLGCGAQPSSAVKKLLTISGL